MKAFSSMLMFPLTSWTLLLFVCEENPNQAEAERGAFLRQRTTVVSQGCFGMLRGARSCSEMRRAAVNLLQGCAEWELPVETGDWLIGYVRAVQILIMWWVRAGCTLTMDDSRAQCRFSILTTWGEMFLSRARGKDLIRTAGNVQYNLNSDVMDSPWTSHII